MSNKAIRFSSRIMIVFVQLIFFLLAVGAAKAQESSKQSCGQKEILSCLVQFDRKACDSCPQLADEENTIPNDEVAKASYALGVKFYREVTQKFEQFDYVQFLKGVKKVTDDPDNAGMTNSDLNESIDAVVVKSVQSDKFLRDYIALSNVVPIKGGVFVVKNIEKNVLKSMFEKSDRDGCKIKVSTINVNDENKYEVSYLRLKLDTSLVPEELAYTVGDKPICIKVEKSQMIRGWRTVLNQMEQNDLWEVVIPSELGYGSRGAKGGGRPSAIVEKNVALRFYLKLHKKP